MKRITFSIILSFFVSIGLLPTQEQTASAQQQTSGNQETVSAVYYHKTGNKAELGKKLYIQILDRYPKLDRSFKPSLSGAATSDPLVELLIPIDDWNSLSEADRGLLAIYAASLVNEVKANPFPYANISASAPIAPFIRHNVSTNMTSDSWIIKEGEIFELKDVGIIGENGKEQDMSSGRTLLSGKER